MSTMARCGTAGFMVLAVLFLTGSAVAGVVTQHYDFAEPTVRQVGEYHRVTMEGAWHHGDPGDPILPMVGARLLLPPGEDVAEVRVVPGEKVVLGEGLLLEPGQRQYPLSYDGPIERIEPDYTGRAAFPGRIHDPATVGTFRGYAIASLALHPVEYDPATGTLSYYRSMDVEIRTAPSARLRDVAERMIRHDPGTHDQLSRYIDNDLVRMEYAAIERVKQQTQSPLSLDPDLGYDYLIITTDNWDDYLGDIVTHETNRGYKAGIFLKSWIVANYTGIDEQDQIRNFIIDAYTTWDSEYVLLVGDARDPNGIPHRGMWNDAYGYNESDIPCDLYYAALDGNWNADGDGKWGEYSPEEADLYPELAIGRFCVDDVSEVQNSVTKTLLYTDPPPAVRGELDEALMAGELLWTDPLTYGGDSKDQVLYGGSYNGYTTVGFFPSMPNTDRLYDRDVGTWTKSQLISLMENGLNIVNHLGHCGTQYSMRMYNSDIPSFDNDGTNHTLNFAYSQGCYNGSFDDRDQYGSYVGDCFAEEFATDDDGAVALVMNSRYGWGDPGGTNGSSQFFDREFFDAIFGEGIYPIGHVNNDSKVDVIWALNYAANRWCYYELNVFGDPAMHLWTDEPGDLMVDHPGDIMIGQPDMEVAVYDAGRGPVEGAQVTIYTDDYAVYDTGVTDATGVVIVHPNATEVGMLNIKVHAHDFLTYDGTADIAPAEGPYVALDHYVVDDDQVGESNGNGNGAVNSGETIELVVTLKNVGVDAAYGVTAVLSSSSPAVTIIDDGETFGDIPAGGTAACADDYGFSVEPDTPDGEVIPFTLTIQDAGRTVWESNFSIVVGAPVLIYADHVADDPLYGGNGSGCIEPGETILITVDLSNVGSTGAWGVSADLSSSDPYVMINSGTASIPVIGPGGTQTLTPDYNVTVLPNCPEFHDIMFDLAISADWGYTASAQFSVLTAGGSTFSDNVESGQGEWTHSNVTPGFVDQWHIETYRSWSPSHSWKFGGSGGSDYASSSDGALSMRPMCIGADGELTFWDWLDAEEESSTSAWDCGLLEISTDLGATWENLAPVGGYSHEKNSNPANPLPEGTPCWSGYHDWREEVFDLSAYAGETIQIRFRFASDGYVEEEGWYVDDINLTYSGGGTGVDGDLTGPLTFALGQNVPNPFNPLTVIRYQLPQAADVRIDVFNIAGRLVKTIVDEHQEPGFKEAVWDGTNEGGERVASGVYMYRMEAGDYTSKKRMVLLK